MEPRKDLTWPEVKRLIQLDCESSKSKKRKNKPRITEKESLPHPTPEQRREIRQAINQAKQGKLF